ncbi:MAG: hypothetical protein QOD91_549, partial [Frankiales bacterium]|nr:hypothetical protein [Frankiales bacterium]
TILKPAFTITKTVSPSGAVHVGDTLTYTITVANTGNTSLDFSMNDHVFGSAATAGCSNYAPGTPATFTIAAGGPDKVLTCTKAAPNQSSYHNEACATGTDSLNQSSTLCDDVTTTILKPAFTITKTVSPSGSVHVGDTLTYTITATNTGDDVLHVSNFDDHVKNTAAAGCTFAAGQAPPANFDLAAAGDPAGGDVRTFTCTHVVDANDANPYTNVACFDATDGVGPVPATFSECGEDSTTPLDAILAITKTVDKARAHDGDQLSYTIKVTNNGRAAASDVQVTDLIDGTSHGCAPLVGPAQGGTLAAGASITYTCDYTVLHADEDSSHHIVNTATVNGKDPAGVALPPQSASATTLIVHPAIAIDKTGPATGQAGDKIGYILAVTNPSDESLAEATVVVTDPQCNGAPVTLLGKGGDASPASLDPGDAWSYSCTVQTAIGDTAVHNTGHVTGCDADNSCVNADDSADTTLTQPEQLLLPARIVPGTAKLQGPTGCAAKAFNVRIRGTKVATVTFILDGKVIKRFKKTVASGVYAIRVNPATMRIGVHRIVANVTFQSGSGTKPKTMRLSFQRCSKKLAAPRFTG